MGVLKKRTDDTMTTTRFTQLATECVTGDTLARIMYEICHRQPQQATRIHNLNFPIGEKFSKFHWGAAVLTFW